MRRGDEAAMEGAYMCDRLGRPERYRFTCRDAERLAPRSASPRETRRGLQIHPPLPNWKTLDRETALLAMSSVQMLAPTLTALSSAAITLPPRTKLSAVRVLKCPDEVQRHVEILNSVLL